MSGDGETGDLGGLVLEKFTLSARKDLIAWCRDIATAAGIPLPAMTGLAVRHYVSQPTWRRALVEYKGGKRMPGATSVVDVQLSKNEREMIFSFLKKNKINKAVLMNLALESYKSYLALYRAKYSDPKKKGAA